MQVQENWSEIEAVIEGSGPSDVDGHAALDVRVVEVRAVPGYANLLAQRRGETIRVLVPSRDLEAARPAVGSRVCLRVRAASLTRFFGLLSDANTAPPRDA